MGEAKRKRSNLEWATCAYCGAPRTSRDHVPPRSLFVGHGLEYLTVPACEEHNGKRSDLDEQFREMVSFWVGDHTPITKTLWQTTVRALSYNRKRYVDIRRRTRWIPKIDQYQLPFPTQVFDDAVSWICRGLYWHHARKPLPLSVNVETHLIDPKILNVHFEAALTLPIRNSLVNDQFFYHGGITDDVPTASMWYLVFHNRLVALGITDSTTVEEKGRAARNA